MIEPLDIFIKMQDGTYVWKAAAESFELAKSKVEELAAKAPGEYMIFSQTTGNKIVIKPDGLPEPGTASAPLHQSQFVQIPKPVAIDLRFKQGSCTSVRMARTFAVEREPTTLTVSSGFSFTEPPWSQFYSESSSFT